VDDLQVGVLAWLLAVCGGLVLASTIARALLARHTSGRLAQLHFRRVHGVRVVALLGGRLDPRRGSPWIDTFLEGRPVQLVAAPLEGRLQAGIVLLDRELPANVWHTGGQTPELEALAGVDLDQLREAAAQLRELEVDSVACGVPIDSDPRPEHIVRMRFDEVDDLPDRLARLAPVLDRIERLEPATD
jgi:hypothetical protein